MKRVVGLPLKNAVAALPLWLEFMKEAAKTISVEEFTVPDGVVFIKVDKETGEPLASMRWAKSGKVLFECFKEGTEPTPGIIRPARVQRLPDEEFIKTR